MVERGPYVSYANCGLPYHVGERDPGRVEPPGGDRADVPRAVRRRRADALRGDRDLAGEEDRGPASNHATGEVTTETYDKLVLSPGRGADPSARCPASTFRGSSRCGPCRMPGTCASGCTATWPARTGMDSYTGFQTVTKPKRAVVVGGGFIGLEMVENLVHLGLDVTLVEKLNQVMPPLDPEMARLVERYLVKHGVRLELNDGVAGFRAGRGRLARGADDVGQGAPGGHRDPGDRRASGDRAGEDGRPRDRPARRHPRRRAHAHEQPRHLRGRRRGRSQGLRHRPVDAHPARRAGQPPGPDRGRRDRRARLPLPRHAGHVDLRDLRGRRSARPAPARSRSSQPGTRTSRRSTSTRTRTRATTRAPRCSRSRSSSGSPTGASSGRRCSARTACPSGSTRSPWRSRRALTVYDLEEAELCYAPPFGSAKDPVNFAGMVAGERAAGRHADSCTGTRIDGGFLLDVRNPPELAVETVPGAVNIPLPQLRARLGELPRDREILVICRSGGARLLRDAHPAAERVQGRRTSRAACWRDRTGLSESSTRRDWRLCDREPNHHTTDTQETARWQPTTTGDSTGRIKVDTARVDRLKQQHLSTPQEIDNERVRIMAEVYEGTAGYQQIIRRAKFFDAGDRAEEAVHRREPHRRQHGEQRERRLHVSGMERGVDEGREDRREVEDPGRPEGEPVGARVLGQVGAASAGRRDLHQEVRLRSRPRLQGGPHRGVHVLAGRRRQPELPAGLQRGTREHDQGGRGAAEGPRHAAAERLQVLLLRGLPHHDAGRHPARAPLRRAGPRDGGEGAEPRAGAGTARHRRDVRTRARASCQEPAGSHPVPLPLPHLGRDRAGRLRLLGGLPRPEPRAVLPA